jgi:hypothetical protein
MKSIVLFLSIAALGSSAFAAAKPCDELKSEIAAKLDKSGVKNYALEVVPSDKTGDAKVVGSCEGGTKKITYVRK